jgi:hypothetical protein
MKTLRRILIALLAPATLLLGLSQLGGTPISKGYNTGFLSKMEDSPRASLTLSTDVGDLTCWLRLRVPAGTQTFSAKLSTGSPLGVYQDSLEGSHQWLAIVADGQKPQEKFKWPSGATVIVSCSEENPASLTLTDWRVFLSDKDYDSKERARWRRILFVVSAALLVLALIGGLLEGYSKLTEKTPFLTSQRCIEDLISSTGGATTQETRWMRSILTKVLLEGVPVTDALAPLPLSDLKKKALWFKTRGLFRSRLERLILELNNYLSYL